MNVNVNTKLYFLVQWPPVPINIIAVFHNLQNQRNLNYSKSRNTKPQIWAILGSFCPILDPDILFENRASLKIVYSWLT